MARPGALAGSQPLPLLNIYERRRLGYVYMCVCVCIISSGPARASSLFAGPSSRGSGATSHGPLDGQDNWSALCHPLICMIYHRRIRAGRGRLGAKGERRPWPPAPGPRGLLGSRHTWFGLAGGGVARVPASPMCAGPSPSCLLGSGRLPAGVARPTTATSAMDGQPVAEGAGPATD